MANKSLGAHFVKCLKEGNTKKALYIINLLGDKVNALYGAKSLLCWAKEFENDEVARVLEEKGAVEKVISAEEAKKLGLELIEKAEVGDLDAVMELVGKGSNVDEKDEDGDTALMIASKNGHVEVVKALIENGAKVDEKNNNDDTPLMWASGDGTVEVVKALLDAGAKVDEKDEDDVTALMCASGWGHVEVVEALLDAGAKVDEKDEDGDTALIFASRYGCLDVVKTLIENGAKVDIKNNDGKTAMSLAKDEETRRAILEAVKKRNEKAKENEPSFMDRVKGLLGKGK